MHHSSHKFPLLSLILIIYVVQTCSQQCLSFDPGSAPASGSVCPPYLSDQVWLPFIPNAIREVDTIFNSTVLWQITAVQSILSVECYDSLLSLVCNAAFPPCNASTVPLAYFACRSVCTHVNNICSFYFNLYEEAPLNCSQKDVITSEDQWPEEYHRNSFYGFFPEQNTSCLTDLPKGNVDAAVSSVKCPYPLIAVDHIDYTSPPCYIPCPDPTWTPQQWEAMGIIQFSFALPSVILMAFLSIHYIADPKCRKTSRRFHLYSYISQMLFSLAFAIGGPFPRKTTWCADSTTFAGLDKPSCGTQVFLFVVCGLSASIWWAISSAIMYIKLETRQYRISKRKELLFYIMGFIFPIIPFIVAAARNAVTFYWLTPFCFVQYLIEDTRLNYHYILFYIPLCVPMMVAMGFIIATLVKIVKHTRDMTITFKGQQRTGGVSLIKVNVRLFTWCACLFLFFFTILVYRLILERRWQALEEEAYTWGVCKVKYNLGMGSDELCPESKFPRPINYPGTVVHYIICTSVGTLTFLSFGTTKNMYYFWFYAATLAYARDWNALRDLLTNEKAFSAMRNRDSRKSTEMSNMGEAPIRVTPQTSTTETSGDLAEQTAERSDVIESDVTI